MGLFAPSDLVAEGLSLQKWYDEGRAVHGPIALERKPHAAM